MKKKFTIILFTILCYQSTTHAWIEISFSTETKKIISQTLERAKVRLTELDASLDKLDKTVTKLDTGIDKLTACLNPQQQAKSITQLGIVLSATAGIVLSTYLLIWIIKQELAKYDKDPSQKTNWKTLSAASISTAFLGASIFALLKSDYLAQ